ncbi:regulatory-associated protein of TOR 1-like isoform X2 [Zingiber officinale]|uniref:regulatory-associated protein of TOR 1-like isoform X2 n=1 Tax=Zingiber officinale TaxID=94328 RepID=UPI001C4BBBFF|nr:regulatory-associated protein of TOR 1-like isoform X2 [Zingiber officinale]
MPTTSALGTGPLEVRFNKVIESLVDQIDLSEEEAEVCLKLLLNEANEALIRAFSKRGNVDNSVKCNCADLFQRLFSPFFTKQLKAFEVWLAHGSEHKKPPEQLPVVLQVDLVKDGGHTYFIRFHDSMDAYAEQRAMAAFVLAVVVDGHRRRQEACIQANFLNVSLKHLQIANPSDGQTEPLLLHGFVYVWARKALGRFSISTNHRFSCRWSSNYFTLIAGTIARGRIYTSL